ncbi:DUF397 domain-containing protein [Actinokineospora guangxiensis]|uniref:DUF397 domain-containing protein n=1 Tax=Actinokineospora guangxiensis TaxID=1490288 RepID=A0ABW0EJ30_9PSEU
MPRFLRAEWGKSSRGSGNNGNCVERAHSGAHAGVRDSKNAEGPMLIVPASALNALVSSSVTQSYGKMSARL